MGKKKGAKEVPSTLRLGRPGNNIRMGIVGLPNVGKSSFFNLLCEMDVPAENYPFCTIEPSVSRVPVPDKRFDKLCADFKPKSIKPAVLGVTDIAGLVKGASEGAGLGNAFLSNIQACDGIFHMVRIFTDSEVTHVENSIDPVRDVQIINNELLLKDKAILTNLVDGKRKNIERGVGGKEAKAEFLVWEKALALLVAETPLRFHDWTPKECFVLNQLQLLTAKPQIYLVNMSARGFKTQKSASLPKLMAYLKEHGHGELMVPYSVAYEKELFDMGKEAAAKHQADTKVPSQLGKIIKLGYKCLSLIHFFTCGPDEVRGWTIQQGTLAPGAAGTIHTDFEKGFICADTYAFKDYRKQGGEQKVKAAGLMRQQGRNYEVMDGDCCHFKFNPPKASKKAKK